MDSYSSSLWSLLSLIIFTMTTISARSQIATPEFIRSSCQITRYPDVCVKSMSSSLGSLRAKQNEFVKAAVNVSLFEARNVSKWANRLAKNKTISKLEMAALNDCVENFGDTFDQIKRSLVELRHLRTDTFKFQMSDVQTWMSAALTNENTCLDGFDDLDGSIKDVVCSRVQNICQLISNALALVNNLAASGGY